MSNVSECVCVDGCVCVGGGVGRHIVAACVSHPRGPSLVPPRVHHVVGDQPLAAVYRTPSATSQVVIVHEGGDHPLLAYPSPDAIIRVTRIPLEGRAPGSPGPQLDFAQSFNRCAQARPAWMHTYTFGARNSWSFQISTLISTV